MMGRIEGVPDTVIELALVALALGIVLAFIRLVRGPSLMDRVTSLELIASLVAGIVPSSPSALMIPRSSMSPSPSRSDWRCGPCASRWSGWPAIFCRSCWSIQYGPYSTAN